MAKTKGLDPVRFVVIVAIGAALYGLGGMIGVPIFANTTLKPAMAILGLFAALYGPIVGFLVGFLGHWITDLFMGWGVWFTWVLGSGLVGIMIGLFKYWSKDCVHEGNLPGMQILLFIVVSFVANFLGYLVSALLDAVLYTEPLDKVFTQQILAATTNTLMIGTLGTLLLYLVARRNASGRDLKKDETA